MANAHVRFIDAEGIARELDVDLISVDGVDVIRERTRFAGAAASELSDARATDPATSDVGIVTRPLQVVSPVRDVLSAANLAAGANVDLDGTTIAAGHTGKLMGVTVASSVAAKWQIKSRDGAVELTFATVFTGGLSGKATEQWTPPDKRFTILLGNAIDENFRVTVTNLDFAKAADMHSTLFWDEV